MPDASGWSRVDLVGSRRWWLPVLLSVTLFLGASWQSSYPGEVADFGVALSLILVWLTLLAALVPWFAIVLEDPHRRSRQNLAKGLVVAGFLASTVLIAKTDLDLRARFALSEESLKDLVEQRASAVSKERRAGLYTVQDVEVLAGGEVRLVTHACGLDDLDMCGFAYLPNAELRSRCVDYGGVDYHRMTATWYSFRTIEICPS